MRVKQEFKNLVMIISLYISTNRNKSKGSGLGIYLHKSLNSTKPNDFNNSNTNIESFLIKITSKIELIIMQ